MFEITAKDVLLSNLNTRTEKHGDEDVPAATLTCKYTGNNDLLDMFCPKLKASFFEKVDREQAELIQNDMLPDLKFQHKKPFDWQHEYEGYRVRLVNDLNHDEARFIFADCTIKNIKFHFKDGGSVTVEFSINCDPEPEAIAYLYKQQAHNILMTLEPPQEAQLDDLASGFGSSDQPDTEGLDENGIDLLFGEALEFLRGQPETVSISRTQRHFKIGYNRAERIIEQLQKAGWVSESDEEGKRTFIEQDEAA